MQLSLRLATIDDLPVLTRFNMGIAEETEHLRLDPERLSRGIAELLSDAAKGFYLLAELKGRVVGQLMVTYEWSDWRNGVFWWIQSVYVDDEHRGKGVFSRLFREVADRARRDSTVCGLRLYVERHNQRARQVYEHLGMARTTYEVCEMDFVLNRN